MAEYHYTVSAEWTGNTGTGTSGHRDYERSVTLTVDGKPAIFASADQPFRGDPEKWNPEDLLMSALVECHMLSYFHACVKRGVIVTSYRDSAVATLVQEGEGGYFREAHLNPVITVADSSMVDDAIAAHTEANEWCFIANSVNFPIHHDSTVTVG